MGLQASFYRSETDCNKLTEISSSQISSTIGVANRSTTVGMSIEDEEIEQLRRRAKLSAIYFTDGTSVTELKERIEQVERYSQRILHADSSLSQLLQLQKNDGDMSNLEKIVSLENQDEDDIDGVAIDGADIDGEPINTSSFTINVSNHSSNLDGCDDIDGEPIDDDIDGVPIDDDIDGAPIDDNIHGMPLQEDDSVSNAFSTGNGFSTNGNDSDDSSEKMPVASKSHKLALRQLEEKLLAMRDQLESSGNHSETEIEQMISRKRQEERLKILEEK